MKLRTEKGRGKTVVDTNVKRISTKCAAALCGM